MGAGLRGRRVRIVPFGCRTNLCEADALACALVARGAEVVAEGPFDAAVVMTCTVTAMADRKCRQAIRRLHRECPGAVVAASGCWAQRVPEEEARALGVRLLVGNRKKSMVPELLAAALNREIGGELVALRDGDLGTCREWDPLRLDRPLLHTRAFVKVQDGCDHFCSYCVIPLVRGGPVSCPLPDVVEEVRCVAASGCPEIVLAGIHLGLYGREGGRSLGDLVRAVAAVEGVRRIRFGSLEPFGVDDELLAVLSDTPAFCRHLHLPVQSGSASVLAAMRRGYSPEEYLSIVGRVRSALGEDSHISTDILVGFPGETEEDFSDTVFLMRECRFGRVHVFPYSPRPGTGAFSMGERVAPEVAADRVRRAMSLGGELLQEYASRWRGGAVSVLVEEAEGERCSGLTPEFLRVEAEGQGSPGREMEVSVREARRGILLGRASVS